jgi:hypothetical protein
VASSSCLQVSQHGMQMEYMVSMVHVLRCDICRMSANTAAVSRQVALDVALQLQLACKPRKTCPFSAY